MAVTALYVHVPFCAQKCRYCDFDSRSFAPCDLSAVLDAFFEQLYARLDAFGDAGALAQIRTVYVGGGTPSLAGERLVELCRRISAWCKPVEFTCEANPESLTAELATALAKVGVTRVSLGVQTLDNAELTAIGRIHDADRALVAIRTVKDAGLDVSCDLMCGLPGQTAVSWQRTLDGVLAAAPHHVSVYPLTLEEGTPLFAQRKRFTLPDDDAQADMYLYTVAALGEMGYEQYEISNFAKSGKESRHNLKYWRMEEYAGFGPGAHSDFGGVRYGYVRDIDSYIAGRLVLSESETDSTLARDYEYVMLSLRTAAGIDRQTFEKRYRQRFQPMETLFEQYEKAGLASRTEGGWRLTPRGFLVSNSIIAALQEALAQQRAARQAAMAEGNFRIV